MEAGAVGGVKQLKLTYCRFVLQLELMGLHPGNRFGISKVSPLSWPRGSPPISNVNGVPELAVKIPPISHPPAMCDKAHELDFGDGTDQIQLATKFLPTLKSHRPFRCPGA